MKTTPAHLWMPEAMWFPAKTVSSQFRSLNRNPNPVSARTKKLRTNIQWL
ncbi:MAG: hypothetical protein P8Y75_08440 [Nitrospirota bacterium]